MTTYYIDSALGSDSNAGTSAGSGNAWLTIQKGLSTWTAGDLINAKGGTTYSISTGLTNAVGTSNKYTRLSGYTTTPGDGGQITIRATAAIVGLTTSNSHGFQCENVIFDGNSTGTKGITNGNCMSNSFVNCKVMNWTQEAILASSTTLGLFCQGCEMTGCGGTNAAVQIGSGGVLLECWIHDNTITGVYAVDNVSNTIHRCRICNNSGATSDGISIGYHMQDIESNTIDNNGRHGINLRYPLSTVRYNIITRSGGYGLLIAGTTAAVNPAMNMNAYYTNTSGSYSGVSAGPNDVALSGLPYPGAGNYALNGTAGAGAACKALTPSGLDLGALQSVAAASGLILPRPFNGGYSA